MSLEKRGDTWYIRIELPRGPNGKRRRKRIACRRSDGSPMSKREAIIEQAKLIADRTVTEPMPSIVVYRISGLEVIHGHEPAKLVETFRAQRLIEPGRIQSGGYEILVRDEVLGLGVQAVYIDGAGGETLAWSAELSPADRLRVLGVDPGIRISE